MYETMAKLEAQAYGQLKQRDNNYSILNKYNSLKNNYLTVFSVLLIQILVYTHRDL